MTLYDLYALLPFEIVLASAVIVMLVIAFCRHHALTLGLTLLGLALAFAALFFSGDEMPRQVTPLLSLDGYAWYYLGLILLCTAVTALLAYGYLRDRDGINEEFYVLLLSAALGAMVLVSSTHFAAFFLGLELLSIGLFTMIGYTFRRDGPLEAAIKYLILAGLSSALLLFGFALIYVKLGTMDFARIADALGAGDFLDAPYLLVGLALVVVGLGFKLSVVPFHMWAPDVYEGAPAPVAGFIAAVSKAAVFALLLRYWVQIDAYRFHSVYLVLTIIALASMLAGNLLALLQNDVKRILAYSSIAHLGYLLVAFLAGGSQAVEAVNYYLGAYVVTILGAFAVVTVVSAPQARGDAGPLALWRGLFWRRPWLAGIFTAMLLSLAGIPLTAGFVAKFYVLMAGVHVGTWWLVFTLIVGSAIGLFYYLRIIVVMYAAPPQRVTHAEPARAAVPSMGALALAALTLAVIWIGVYPGPLIDFIQRATTHF